MTSTELHWAFTSGEAFQIHMSWEASARAHCFADVIRTAPTVQRALRWLSKNPAHKYTNPATRHLILTRIIVELINE